MVDVMEDLLVEDTEGVDPEAYILLTLLLDARHTSESILDRMVEVACDYTGDDDEHPCPLLAGSSVGHKNVDELSLYLEQSAQELRLAGWTVTPPRPTP